MAQDLSPVALFLPLTSLPFWEQFYRGICGRFPVDWSPFSRCKCKRFQAPEYCFFCLSNISFYCTFIAIFIDLWLRKNKYCYQKVFAFSDPAPSLPQVLLQQLERGHLRSSQQVGHKLCCQKSCSLRKICTDVITQASQIGNINLPFFFKHQTQIAFLSIHLFCCFWEHVHFIKIDSLISRQEQKNQLKVGVLYFYFTYTGKNPFHGVENCRLFLVSPDLLPLNICKRTFDSVFLNLLWKQSLSTNLT